MSLRKTLILIAVGWLIIITLIHAWLNLHLFDATHTTATGEKKFRIGFLPVTCHLTCPVTDFINKQMTGESLVRETLDKLPFPEDVAVSVDVDPFSYCNLLWSARSPLRRAACSI